MRIVLCYTRINEPTLHSLRDYWVTLTYVGTGPRTYLHRMQELWMSGEGFVNVEHDVVVQPGQIEQLRDCPHAWCAFNEYDGGPPSLSLARFTASFMKANADLWHPLLFMERPPQPLWSVLDSWLVTHADRTCHLHESPHVLNTRPWGTLHSV